MNKIRFCAWALLFAFIGTSCSNDESSRYPGFTTTADGVMYKLHVPGESGKKPTPNDFLELRLRTYHGKQLVFDSEWQSEKGTVFVPFSTNPYYGMLAEGDSATLMIPPHEAEEGQQLDTIPMEMQVKVVRVLSAAEYEKETVAKDPDVEEQLLIAKYLRKENLSVKADSTGLYVLSMRMGNGAGPERGKKVAIHYTGYFLDGRVFDDTRRRKQPLEFNWGEEGQIIKGLSLILSRMKAGSQAKIILPSPLAFGSEGSSTGLIAPHSPVVYDIELLEVN